MTGVAARDVLEGDFGIEWDTECAGRVSQVSQTGSTEQESIDDASQIVT
jgi:hypothetical protein